MGTGKGVSPVSPTPAHLLPFTVGVSHGPGSCGLGVGGRGHRAAKVQDRQLLAPGKEEGAGGALELLRVVPRVVLCDDLLQAKGQGRHEGSGCQPAARTFQMG